MNKKVPADKAAAGLARLEARRLQRVLRRRWLKTGADQRLISAAQRWSA